MSLKNANENAIDAKSFNFAVRTVKLYQHLTENKHENVISKQLLRSGTSIGANVSEAEQGQTRADFTAKMHIALKEANETEYWIRLLYATEYLSESEYKSISNDIKEILRLLTSICKTSNQRTQPQKSK